MATSKERELALATDIPPVYPELPPPYPDLKETPPPYVQYVPSGPSGNRFGGLNPASSVVPPQGSQHKTTRLTKRTIVKSAVFASIFVAIAVVAILLLLRFVKEKEYPMPPEVANLSLVAVAGDSFTATWDRPEGRFDYYWIEVMDDGSGAAGGGLTTPHRVGTCSNGTIIHPDRTQVTCGHIDACSNVSLNVRTHVTGPPERTSAAVVLQGIFIPGKDPDPPKNITVAPESPSQSRISWDPPVAYTGVLDEYAVKVCYTFDSCDAGAEVSTCREFNTPDTSLHFESTVDTSYCVLVTTTARCGNDILRSSPEVAQIRTPSFAPGDFKIYATATDSRTVEIEVFVPEVKNGALEKCYGTMRGPGSEINFLCNEYGGKSSTITLSSLQPGTEYNCTVTFANLYDGREMATRKSISVRTPEEPVERDWNQETWEPRSHDRPYMAAGVALLPVPAVLFVCAAAVLSLRGLQLQHH
ncbi:uncharacterized protein [Dermacentor andersoni]|uniref:uncharacterized protein n=1 Tax=Dermacentor andersoni TaxID=34620 RepID=UPI002155141A|nr:uncharacterized protein LOC126544301 [Dermacentor andersoni]